MPQRKMPVGGSEILGKAMTVCQTRSIGARTTTLVVTARSDSSGLVVRSNATKPGNMETSSNGRTDGRPPRQAATASRAEPQAKNRADGAEQHRKWESHEQANGAVESEGQYEAAKAEKAKNRNPVSGRKRNLAPERCAESRKKADDDRQTEKETPAVELENANTQRCQAETQ